ncbi:MAG TPA: betaine/proline/choline family ABC transporter ATP-binding protein [Candidatus Limnocylindrales bacterium]|nr:betaine/proline/choline family ABC transporter ATP-binding protein [Candidatus Limnocylindrales bacterium]
MPRSVYVDRVQSGATVELRNVTKHYDRQGPAGRGLSDGVSPGAVNDLSLTVPAGQTCVLVGPSGCGKTTTLKMVNRLIEPTSGQILIDGRDIALEDPVQLRRRIGYVIQQVGLFPHQTIGQNVTTVPGLLGWSRQRMGQRADELLALVGLEPGRYRDRFPAQLSGGERQRVGVARALAADPPLLLMDEPFGAVDPIVRERLQDELLMLQEQLAKTILFVTHDVDEAIKMADLIAVFEQAGRLAQIGAPSEILAKPASDYVARFVGADRGLKRLSLRRVADVEWLPALTARTGDDAAEIHRRAARSGDRYVLIVDGEDRPVGWLSAANLPTQGSLSEGISEPMSPLLDRRATLRDALSMLLAADVMAGVVVDERGRTLGLLTIEQIAGALRDA